MSARARGQLPKAYLRLDPNVDSHPDLEAIVILMLYANRQPERGRFKSLDTFRKLLGRRRLDACLERGDLRTLADGRWLLVGWDEWQEGDFTVGERMERLREKKRNEVTNGAVSDSVTNPSPPSEASRRLGVYNTPPIPPAHGTGGNNGQNRQREELREVRRQMEHCVEAARQYLVANGQRAGPKVLRKLREWARAGHTLDEMQGGIDKGNHLPTRRP